MEKDLRKKFEEAAKNKNPYSKYNGEWMQGYLSGMYEEGLLVGAELGYKEAITQAKEWLKNNVSDYAASYIVGCSKGEFISDFETDMNKLWEEK